ncbi:hypothetical protein, partial [Rhodanobacter lindaniclasticus]
MSGFLDAVLVDGSHALAAEFDALDNADVALLDAADGGAGTARRHAGRPRAWSGCGDGDTRSCADR